VKLQQSEVKHMRQVLAWIRVEYHLDEDMQRGALSAVKTLMDAGDITQEEAEHAVANRASQITQVPKYIRHGVKMLTKALRAHDGVKGDVLDVVTRDVRSIGN
jgi:hypothetical protein